ncbi:MAG: DNA starvation/stationary phase protection protein Dps [Deltaproteobacteria bacterium]|nr:DNA starvation/stationary phase protection protein Dps [Deltaproteobacteria bacterium]
MYATPSRLPLPNRTRIVEVLNLSLADGTDLYTQAKAAHWNLKGPHFASLHSLFDGVASAVLGFNDEIAERAVALGGRATGTLRQAAKGSRIPELTDSVRDLELARHLADRVDGYLEGLRAARRTAEEAGDDDTVDLLTGVATEMEKQGWFLRATLEG